MSDTTLDDMNNVNVLRNNGFTVDYDAQVDAEHDRSRTSSYGANYQTGMSPRQQLAIMHRSQNASNSVNVHDYERWTSVAIGGSLVFLGLTRRIPAPWFSTALGAALLYRGVTGHCHAYAAMNVQTATPEREAGIPVEKAVTINRPAHELYAFWRDFTNLPRIMEHLEAVVILEGDGQRSRWTAKAPLGQTVSWDAETIEDVENQRISWRSLEGSQIETAGTVRFVPAPGGRGTEVHVSLAYNPPAGMIGATIAKLFGEEPSIQVDRDLRKFKMLMEAGEIATIEGQPSGRGRD